MWNCHSWPLDATTGGSRSASRSATWSANMSSHSRNVKLLFLTTRCHYCRSANWSANMSSNSRNVKLPFLTTRCHYWGASRSATWSANMSSNSSNVKLPFLTNRCQYQGGRSATWSANMSSNSRNVKLPFLTTRCQYWGRSVLDLPIWALTVEMWNYHSWPLDVTTGGRSASRSWSANMSSNSRNVKLPFLTTRCQYQGVDLPLDLPIWALTVEMWNCHSWPLDATTGG